MNTIHLTPLEKILIRRLATSEFGDGAGSQVWSNCLECSGLPARSIPGVVSSLCKKGLAISDGYGSDSTVSLTDTGCEVWESLK